VRPKNCDENFPHFLNVIVTAFTIFMRVQNYRKIYLRKMTFTHTQCWRGQKLFFKLGGVDFKNKVFPMDFQKGLINPQILK